jgi:hypothetical protein
VERAANPPLKSTFENPPLKKVEPKVGLSVNISSTIKCQYLAPPFLKVDFQRWIFKGRFGSTFLKG